MRTDKIKTRKALLTCANNFLPQNNQGPNELSIQFVKRGQMPFKLSQDPGDIDSVRMCACDCRERAWLCIVTAYTCVNTRA